ncbi:unnamed protein product [Ambrosiozyma monospora]|uniref:Unnamed protein product n=1 Tax=Ambrosiozyma monospora TaxID=43982 RepID=A0ACB5T2P4_AMBMO|nr:unnamed protein product [Ambrosiozyma monospora]
MTRKYSILLREFSRIMINLPFEVQDIVFGLCFPVLLSDHHNPISFIRLMPFITTHPNYKLERLTVDRSYWESSDDGVLLNCLSRLEPTEVTKTNFISIPFREIAWFERVTRIEGIGYNRLAPSVKQLRFLKLKFVEVNIPSGTLKVDLLEDIVEHTEEKVVLTATQFDMKMHDSSLEFIRTNLDSTLEILPYLRIHRC